MQRMPASQADRMSPKPLTVAGELADLLRKRGKHGDAQRVIDAIETGSTGTEILMALRWHVSELIKAGELTPDEEELAQRVVSEINDTGV